MVPLKSEMFFQSLETTLVTKPGRIIANAGISDIPTPKPSFDVTSTDARRCLRKGLATDRSRDEVLTSAAVLTSFESLSVVGQCMTTSSRPKEVSMSCMNWLRVFLITILDAGPASIGMDFN